MTKKQKVLLCVSIAEFCAVILIVIIFNLPCTKAVSWHSPDWENSEIVAVNTKGRTNFSEQINKELDDFIDRWTVNNLKVPREVPDYTYLPMVSFTVLSNTSNLCVVRLHVAIHETDRIHPVNDLKVKTMIGEEIVDYYIYVDSKNESIITKFETVKDTYPYNDNAETSIL